MVKKERSKTDPGPLKPSGGISGFLATVGGQGLILRSLSLIVKLELILDLAKKTFPPLRSFHIIKVVGNLFFKNPDKPESTRNRLLQAAAAATGGNLTRAPACDPFVAAMNNGGGPPRGDGGGGGGGRLPSPSSADVPRAPGR